MSYKIGDWLTHEPTGDVFRVEKIWGEWVLRDNYIDCGDVFLLDKCRMATSDEIEKEKRKRMEDRLQIRKWAEQALEDSK